MTSLQQERRTEEPPSRRRPIPQPFVGRICPQCFGRMPSRRQLSYRTCSRRCLLLSIGLPADFDASLLNRSGPLTARAEHEMRVMLDSIILAAVARVRR